MNKTKANLIANRIINSAEKHNAAPFTHQVVMIDDKYVFMDGYRVIRFDKDWSFENPKEVKQDDYYNRVINSVKECMNNGRSNQKKEYELVLPDIDYLKDNIKMQKDAKVVTPTYILDQKKNENVRVKLNANYLKDMLDLYGNDIVAYYNPEWYYVYFTDENGNDGIVMMIRGNG